MPAALPRSREVSGLRFDLVRQGRVFVELALEAEEALLEPLVADHCDEDRERHADRSLQEDREEMRADPARHRIFRLLVVEKEGDDPVEDVDAVAVLAEETHRGMIEEAPHPITRFRMDAVEQ